MKIVKIRHSRLIKIHRSSSWFSWFIRPQTLGAQRKICSALQTPERATTTLPTKRKTMANKQKKMHMPPTTRKTITLNAFHIS